MSKNTSCCEYHLLALRYFPVAREQGRTHGGRRGPPWDLKNAIFSGFLPLNYAICILKLCCFKLFAMWED